MTPIAPGPGNHVDAGSYRIQLKVWQAIRHPPPEVFSDGHLVEGEHRILTQICNRVRLEDNRETSTLSWRSRRGSRPRTATGSLGGNRWRVEGRAAYRAFRPTGLGVALPCGNGQYRRTVLCN